MKKKLLGVGLVAAVLFFSLATWTAASNSDYQVIKRAVNDEGSARPTGGKEAAVLKIEVKDSDSGKIKVKVSVPLSLVELFAACDHHHEWAGDHCDIDLPRVLAELKKAGPQALVEVTEDDESVRIWLE